MVSVFSIFTNNLDDCQRFSDSRLNRLDCIFDRASLQCIATLRTTRRPLRFALQSPPDSLSIRQKSSTIRGVVERRLKN